MALIGTVSVELFATSRAATDFDAVFIYAMLGDRVLSFPTCCPVGELAAQGGIAHRPSLADALVCARIGLADPGDTTHCRDRPGDRR